MTNYSERRRLDGRHVIITGAYGGIGRALCQSVRSLGARITAIDVVSEADDPLWQELEADFISLDLGAGAEDIAAALADVGPVHGLANVAAVESIANFPDYDDEEFARVLNINTRGPLYMMQALRPHMADEMSVVNIITMDALIVLKTIEKSSALYAGSKAALAMMTRELAAELGPAGIRVNGVAPGLTHTPISAIMPDDRRRWIVGNTAVGRIGQPEDIAATTAFLLSPAARFITGQIIAVDGGLGTAIYGPPELAV
jgi:3alpha(or 20beta)-hydroxysteroid dehydrogenase